MSDMTQDIGGPTLESDGSWLGNLLDKFPFVLRKDSMRSFAFAWLFIDPATGKWDLRPRRCENASQFYNAVFFLRLSWPFGVSLSLRFSDSTQAHAIIQLTLGWKLNGRIAFELRLQSDQTSAAGVSGPNTGQATGWNFGTH
jgi:hypothetical protein